MLYIYIYVISQPFPSSGRVFLLIKNLLPNNGRCSVVCFVVFAWKENLQSRSLATTVSLVSQFLFSANMPQYYLKRNVLFNMSVNISKIIWCISVASILIYRSVFDYLSIYGSTALCWTLAAFQYLDLFTQSVGLLGRGISLSQCR
jgi:hypothetical protein